ncbi:2-hydroxyacid dehydrogenase [Ideonella azotifigens]|uniref:2-hydroxyacid dehydrogenase n=1 Tax=Ideonella azotifigens TaxID=513160 RepID=A0ABN1K8A5_9BURK|nr:2-hydroxyacid dehydrogenase [Ideonella azotifigens]MCD2342943.1 2-hydroxyacid dehydrogenase [Ideonella azotifigens]
MHITVFSSRAYDRRFLDQANASHGFTLTYLEPRLEAATAVLADGADAVCVFVNDKLDATVLQRLATLKVRLVALRCAGFNNVDLAAAKVLGLSVGRVPAYSPHAVAEHTLALLLALNRRLHRAYNRVREGNFMLDGLMGFDLHGKTVGVVGTGRIGVNVVRILRGFGCRVLTHDPLPSPECLALGAEEADRATLLAQSDLITLHCPLTPDTRHWINVGSIAAMRPGVMLINTSRGALVDTLAVIDALKTGQIGALGLDVYEEEADLFFEDLSDQPLQDDVFARLLTFPNVLITGHQGFFTHEALTAIAETTLANVASFARDGRPLHPVN